MLSVEFEDYINGILETIKRVTGSSAHARYLGRKNYFRIKTAFYEDENPEDVAKEILLSVKDSINENTVINEAKGINEPIRRIVRDLTNIIKTKEYGDYNLPEDINNHQLEYDFDEDYRKLNLSRSYDIPPFSIEFNYDANFNMDEPYMINGSLLSDGDTIAIILIINPEQYPSFMYDLIADLNDIVSHEIEHIFQENFRRPEEEIHNVEDGEEEPTGKEYYMQKHEIPAQLKGIKRVAKLRKQSIEQVISDWFKRSKYAHQLNDEDAQYMVKFLTSEYEKRYGTV